MTDQGRVCRRRRLSTASELDQPVRVLVLPQPGRRPAPVRPPGVRHPPPTYRLEFEGPAGTTVLRAGLGYVRALRWTVRLGHRLRREGLPGELRVVEEAFGMLVARRRIEAAAAEASREGVAKPRPRHGEEPKR